MNFDTSGKDDARLRVVRVEEKETQFLKNPVDVGQSILCGYSEYKY